MCGITGFWDTYNNDNLTKMEETVEKMTCMLVSRGPDDKGRWVDPETGIGLGHRRLAIIDLSDLAKQPMVSSSGRYIITYNGEIYNYLELRNQLINKGQKFIGSSDTDVILAAIENWGLDSALRKMIGMFAFALWDKADRKLFLVRDRLGEKPLYYGWMGKTFLFGSELKALRAHPSFKAEIDREALALYLKHNYVPAPYSIYKNVFKLLPGTYLVINSSDPDILPNSQPYWSMSQVLENALCSPYQGTEEEAVRELDHLLREVIKGQMIADVPLGAFLSGGIDSSTVVSIMQAISSKPVKTFSIGFREAGYNEAHYAASVARHLGTDHTELYVTPAEAMEVIPKLPTLYDEPFSDSSQIPTYLVAALARQHVTVSLSGDGGDELFGGYNRYFWGRDIWSKIGWMPLAIRRSLSVVLKGFPPSYWDKLLSISRPILPGPLRQPQAGAKVHKLAEILALESPRIMYQGLISHWKDPATVIGVTDYPQMPVFDNSRLVFDSFVEWMMYLDAVTYLPDDILVKVDRACMGVSLESRVPLLDHRVVEFAWRLPLNMKIQGLEGKRILREVLYQYVPRELIERPKMGFGVPIGEWLQGPLKDWANDMLDVNRLKNEGYLNSEPIQTMWQEHLSGKKNWQYHLWDILMFQAWLHDNAKII